MTANGYEGLFILNLILLSIIINGRVCGMEYICLSFTQELLNGFRWILANIVICITRINASLLYMLFVEGESCGNS